MQARDLLIKEFGVSTHDVENAQNTSVTTSATLLADNNPNRLAITFINTGSNPMLLLPDGTVSSTKGIYLAANGGSMTLTLRDDFSLVTRNWYAVATTSTTTAFTLETIID